MQHIASDQIQIDNAVEILRRKRRFDFFIERCEVLEKL
jgi:hypothetical protein